MPLCGLVEPRATLLRKTISSIPITASAGKFQKLWTRHWVCVLHSLIHCLIALDSRSLSNPIRQKCHKLNLDISCTYTTSQLKTAYKNWRLSSRLKFIRDSSWTIHHPDNLVKCWLSVGSNYFPLMLLDLLYTPLGRFVLARGACNGTANPIAGSMSVSTMPSFQVFNGLHGSYYVHPKVQVILDVEPLQDRSQAKMPLY